jgi:hypothetical protein
MILPTLRFPVHLSASTNISEILPVSGSLRRYGLFLDLAKGISRNTSVFSCFTPGEGKHLNLNKELVILYLNFTSNYAQIKFRPCENLTTYDYQL